MKGTTLLMKDAVILVKGEELLMKDLSIKDQVTLVKVWGFGKKYNLDCIWCVWKEEKLFLISKVKVVGEGEKVLYAVWRVIEFCTV